VKLKLWDQQRGRLVTFRQARAERAETGTGDNQRVEPLAPGA